MNILVLVLYFACTIAGLTLFKIGANTNLSISINYGMFSINMHYLSIIGVGLYIISFLLYLGVISKYNLSYIIPLTSAVVQVLILFISVVVFKEKINLYHILGVSLIILGIILINKK